MHLLKFSLINFWSLEDFNFSNSDVLYWVDRGNFLCDLLFNDFTCKNAQELSSVGFRNFFINDFVNSFSDLFLLRSQSVVSFLLLSLRFPGEGNDKNSDNISISRFTILDSFNKSFSLFN